MASIVLTIGSITRTSTISTADLNRVVAAFKLRYGASLTTQQAFDAWADSAINDLRQTVQDQETGVSKAAVDAAFVPVVIT